MTERAEAHVHQLHKIISNAATIRYSDPSDPAGCALEAYHYLFQAICEAICDFTKTLESAFEDDYDKESERDYIARKVQ